MKSGDALSAFESLLEARGTSVDKLLVPDGIDAMTEFYRNTRAADCSLENDGDLLLFQWGTHDWMTGQGPHFELDITRQFIRAGGDDEDIWQLSLTFVFLPNAIESGDRWCSGLGEIDEFASFVRSHPACAAVAQASPLRVELDYECAG